MLNIHIFISRRMGCRALYLWKRSLGKQPAAGQMQIPGSRPTQPLPVLVLPRSPAVHGPGCLPVPVPLPAPPRCCRDQGSDTRKNPWGHGCGAGSRLATMGEEAVSVQFAITQGTERGLALPPSHQPGAEPLCRGAAEPGDDAGAGAPAGLPWCNSGQNLPSWTQKYNICRVGVRRMGPSSSQWCPVTGQGAMGTN